MPLLLPPLLLLTRPRASSEEMAGALKRAGIASLIDPLLHYEPVATGCTLLAEVIAKEPARPLLMTSREAVRYCADCSPHRAMPLLAVGPATAHAATQAGFSQVSDLSKAGGEDAGSAKGMITEIIAHWPAGTSFIYPSAQHVRRDIPALLRPYGHEVERIICYKTVLTEAWHDSTIEQWQQITGVVLCSRRSAEQFIMLVTQHWPDEKSTAHLTAYCISQDVADALQAVPMKRTLVAAAPHGQAILSTILSS